ncbi:MAG: RnfABCDGE type electron transport complex subunit D [Robiginitomaculum sp.]
MDTLQAQAFHQKVRKLWAFFVLDPRHYQIGILSSLIFIGIFKFGFVIPWWHALACIGAAIGTQIFCDKSIGKKFDIRSPLISSLSLTLLLRTSSIWLSLAAGILAIGSKYLIRSKGKHIFNPANFGIVIVALLFAGAWVSPGQWGSAPMLILWITGLGILVTGKARSWDLTVFFLIIYASLTFIRALWLGDPLSIPVHQLQSGAMLLFAFFMISDPMTTPNARLGRFFYAAFVASIGFTIQTFFYNSAGIIYALIFTAPLVPVFDHLFLAKAYQWPKFIQNQNPKGVSHDKTIQTYS